VTRIDDIFTELRAAGRTTLIPFVTAGYPTLESTGPVVCALEAAGCRIIELGIPFSDPIADGPVIASSMHDALTAGVTPGAIFDLVRDLRGRTQAALVAMVSHSIVLRIGPHRFVSEAAEAGFSGLIIPDLDLEAPEAETAAKAAAEAAMSFICLISPSTPPDRIGRNARRSSGFVYLLARAGITGERNLAPDLQPRIETLRREISLPIAVGFGISSPEQVAAVTAHADAAIVGTGLVRRLEAASDPATTAREYIGGLVSALGAGPGAFDRAAGP
jgi:tryptophan synthase alpha chain